MLFKQHFNDRNICKLKYEIISHALQIKQDEEEDFEE